jgi:hypothetical protein
MALGNHLPGSAAGSHLNDTTAALSAHGMRTCGTSPAPWVLLCWTDGTWRSLAWHRGTQGMQTCDGRNSSSVSTCITEYAQLLHAPGASALQLP